RRGDRPRRWRGGARQGRAELLRGLGLVKAAAGRRVLVTRPEPGATHTAARLTAAGWQPVVVSLSEIVALAPQLPRGQFAAVAASSANAIRHAPRDIVDRRAAPPLFAVGYETASAARAAGFSNVRSSADNAADLARDVA